MTLPAIPGAFRPGGPTSPQPVQGSGSLGPEPYHLQFLTAEERSTAILMGYFQDARLELEDFIRRGDLSVSDATFYRQLLDETNRVGSKLNAQGATWTSSVIPEAHSAAWRTHSNTVVNQGAVEALSRSTLSLITQTTDGIRQSVRQTIAQGILQGLSGEDVRQRIIATGLTNIPHWPNVEYRAGVIARTETMGAYNAGALAGIRANGARYVRWIASPDEATCPICLPRDDKVYRLDAGTKGVPRSVPPAIAKAQPSNWHVSKPWEQPKSAFKAGKVPGFKYVESTDVGKLYGVGNVLAQAKNDAIEVYDSFFDQPVTSRALTLYHEAGHFSMRDVPGGPGELLAEYRNAQGSYTIPWYSGQGQSLSGGSNVQAARLEEVVADTYADLVFGANNADRASDFIDSTSDYSRGKADVYRKVAAAAKGIGLDTTDRWRVRADGLEPGTGEDFFNGPNDPGRIASVEDGDDPNDPYPAAQPVPKIPAHPRCRCTIRAEYRDKNGKVIRQGSDPEEPKLPKDAMGGQDPPTMPPAAGDIRKAVGKLEAEFKGQFLAGKSLSDATLKFWRSIDLDDDAMRWIAGLQGGTIVSAKNRMRAVMMARYGINFNNTAAWGPGGMRASLGALERWRSMNPAFVTDSPYLTHWGYAPLGARKMTGSRAAEMYATCHMRPNFTAIRKYETHIDGYGIGYDDTVEFVLTHELGHSIHNRFGLHSAQGYAAIEYGSIKIPLTQAQRRALSQADEDAYRRAMIDTAQMHRELYEGPWTEIRRASVEGVAPTAKGADLDTLRERIAGLEAQVAERSLPGKDFLLASTQRSLDSAKAALAAAEAQAARIAAGTAGEFYPTDYARKGGYAEDFAESAALYLLNPAKLKLYSPLRYEFLQTKIFGGKGG